MLYLSEQFLGIQGEGRLRGTLSIFIRLARCNRTCEELKVSYTTPDGKVKLGCDSFDSVDVAFKKNWERVHFHDLVTILNHYPQCKNVVITGGEPLLYNSDFDLIAFIRFLQSNNYTTTIETNGDIDIKNPELFKDVIFSISPKGEIKNKLYWFLNNKSYIKVVYGLNISIDYLKELQRRGLDIYIMPMGDTYEKISAQKREVYEYCIKNGFNFTDRDHINILKDEAKNESIVMDNITHDSYIGRF